MIHTSKLFDDHFSFVIPYVHKILVDLEIADIIHSKENDLLLVHRPSYAYYGEMSWPRTPSHRDETIRSHGFDKQAITGRTMFCVGIYGDFWKSQKDSIFIMTHELRHLKQYLNGQLDTMVGVPGYVKYRTSQEDEFVNYFTKLELNEYCKLPWEMDANLYASQFVKSCSELQRNAEWVARLERYDPLLAKFISQHM